jgi:hypothetical protein
MIHFVHGELHALHLTPRLVRRSARRHALLQGGSTTKLLVLFHGLHHAAQARQGFVLLVHCIVLCVWFVLR